MANEKPDRLDDKQRVALLLKSLGPPDYTMEEAAQKLLTQFAEEMACAVLEQAGALAVHRGEKIIHLEDMTLILRKRFGIALPDYALKQPLHRDTVPVHKSIVTTSLKRHNSDVTKELESRRKKSAKAAAASS